MRYILFAVMLLAFGCNKEKSCEGCQSNSDTYKDAVIIYGGPIETDGCGWLVKIDATHTYHADVLQAMFQQDQLAVKINYELTPDKFICGVASLQIPVIHVKDIKL